MALARAHPARLRCVVTYETRGGQASQSGRRLLYAAFAAIVLLYFIRFVGPSLYGGLNNDDPMNIHSVWIRGPGQLVRNLLLFFTTYGRPMGGVYFGALYHFFGLNPFPYHVLLIALFLVNTFLAYRFGRLITGSELAGGLTALMVVYHGEMVHLIYLPAFAYDVLCFTFYFLALTYYLSIRTRGEHLTKKQVVLFLLCYVGALDSKEMAVTLPAVVLLYEVVYHRPGSLSLENMAKWLKAEALPGLIAGGLTVVYVLGKTLGSDSLVKVEAFRPVFSSARYWESTTRFVNTIFYQQIEGGFFNATRFALLAAILLYLAWRFQQRPLLLMWFFVWIAPLPITFIPGRGGACLYIPLAGWAVIVASLFLPLARAAAGSRALRWMPRRAALAVIVGLGIAAFWANTERRGGDVPLAVLKPAQATWAVADEVRAVQPRVNPGSKIYLVHGSLPGYDMKFVMELVYHDRSVNVWVGDQAPLSPGEFNRMDYVMTFENGKLRVLKRP